MKKTWLIIIAVLLVLSLAGNAVLFSQYKKKDAALEDTAPPRKR